MTPVSTSIAYWAAKEEGPGEAASNANCGPQWLDTDLEKG